MSDLGNLGDMIKTVTQAIYGPKSLTYNSLLVHEVMGMRSTEHFERVDSHYTFDGVLVKFRCNIDGREYHVKVTAVKS